MPNHSHTILFMDDEIATADIVRYAIQTLQNHGFSVHTTDRMSVAMDAFYQQYYRVFILDIDMGALIHAHANDGSDVARFLRSLDSDTHVIFFSARGHVHHWFAAANTHVFGYINKNNDDAIGQLLHTVQQAVALPEEPFRWPQPSQPPQQAMLVTLEPCQTVSTETIQYTLQQQLPDWDLHTYSSLDEALSAQQQHPDSWGLLSIITDRFPSRPSTLLQVQQLCRTLYRPQVIVGCCGELGSMPSLLNVVNAHPFRMLDLCSPLFLEQFAESTRLAIQHYGRKELLRSSPQALHRLRLSFSQETYEQLCSSPETEDSLWVEPETSDTSNPSTLSQANTENLP